MRYASPEAALATLGVGLTLPVLSVGCGPVECGSGAKPFVVHGESLDLDLASGLATPGLLDGLPFAYNSPRESGEARGLGYSGCHKLICSPPFARSPIRLKPSDFLSKQQAIAGGNLIRR